MTDIEYQRTITDAKNEIGNLVLRLGGDARSAVAAAAKVERSIHAECDELHKLAQDAQRAMATILRESAKREER